MPRRHTAQEDVCTEDIFECYRTVFQVRLEEMTRSGASAVVTTAPLGTHATESAATTAAAAALGISSPCWLDTEQGGASGMARVQFTVPAVRNASLFPVIFFALLFLVCAAAAARFGCLEDKELSQAVLEAREGLGLPPPPPPRRVSASLARAVEVLLSPLDRLFQAAGGQERAQTAVPQGVVTAAPRTTRRRRNTLTALFRRNAPPGAPVVAVANPLAAQGGGEGGRAPRAPPLPPPPRGAPPTRAPPAPDRVAPPPQRVGRSVLAPPARSITGGSGGGSSAAPAAPRQRRESLVSSRQRRLSRMARGRRRTLEVLEAQRLATEAEEAGASWQ